MTENTTVFPAPFHNFRQFKGRTERLLGWNGEGREVYARSPFADSHGATPAITTREFLPCSFGWYALTFDDSTEDGDFEQDADGTEWRFRKYPILGWAITLSSEAYEAGNPNRFHISRSITPIIPEVTDAFGENEFDGGWWVHAYLTPDGRVHAYHDNGREFDDFAKWCEYGINGLKAKQERAAARALKGKE